ncbi:MAG: DUF5675 family protein [Propionivibrio sp.]
MFAPAPLNTAPAEWVLVREIFSEPRNGREGFTLGRLYFSEGDEQVCFTLEDQDRHLEDGNGKMYGRTAIPTGRYELTMYNSPKHGRVPLFHGVDGYSYVEIHKANHAEELLGCVAVGAWRTLDGVSGCAGVLADIVAEMGKARIAAKKVFITVKRA